MSSSDPLADNASTPDEPSEANEPIAETVDAASQPRTWRRMYEEDYHPRPVDERIKLARSVDVETLRAFCFDPDPRVVLAIYENMSFGMQHARLIAEHHRNPAGLEPLEMRTELLRDRKVQTMLLRNPQTGNRLMMRLLQVKRMSEVYQLCVSRELTERARNTVRREFRKKFIAGSADERVSLILKTEGRCLSLLMGVGLDAKSAALLTRRPLHSNLLIQNLARWPTTPPQVLQHLARQPIVSRSPQLMTLLKRHPNAPANLGKARR